MANLIVLKFPTAEGAKEMKNTLLDLQKQYLLTIHDAAVVSWPQGKKQPKTEQLLNLPGVGALQGAFWGMLFGLIFFVPFFGLAVGAAMGALSGKFADYGVDDNFINSMREKVTEGTSALFLLTSNVTTDKVAEAVKGQEFEIISTNLSKEQEEQLRETFGA